MKAFLSHSSKDKEFVEAVAKELGRQFCTFDKYDFKNGVDFLTSITSGINNSDIFVLFVSREALKSFFVDFEIQCAEIEIFKDNIKKCLVFILDSDISFGDLPQWLHKVKASRAISAKPVAREIRDCLDDLIRKKSAPYFIGRHKDMEVVQGIIHPYDGSTPPSIVMVYGLPGIGKRSFVRKVSENQLNLKKAYVFYVEPGDSIVELAIKVADAVEPYNTMDGLKAIMTQIRAAEKVQLLDRTLANINRLISNGEIPILFDRGGLLTDDGEFEGPVRELIEFLGQHRDVRLFLVSTRKPVSAQGLKSVRLEQLNETDSKGLISSLASNDSLQLSGVQITELCEYVKGFPLAAYFSIKMAKEYGIDLVLLDKKRLVDFQVTTFLKHLERMALSEPQKLLLVTLAAYSPLPLIALGAIVGLTAEELSLALSTLIDNALVNIDEDGYYCIADPISHAVNRIFGVAGNDMHKSVAANLLPYLRDTENTEPKLKLARSLFRAVAFSSEDNIIPDFVHLRNDLAKLTADFYHSRQFKKAIDYGALAIKELPSNTEVRSNYIKALIQEELWDSAYKALQEFEPLARPRDLYFLQGFMHRRHGELQKAIACYEKSKGLGRKDAGIHREMAQCYLSLGNISLAQDSIRKAVEVHGDNRYIVDLWAKISTITKSSKEAELALDRLRILTSEDFYSHRRSTVASGMGNHADAYSYAKSAVNYSNTPTFEMIVQYVSCCLKSNKIDEAEIMLNRLDTSFPKIRNDIKNTLRCKLFNARGKFSACLTKLETIRDRESVFVNLVERDALEGLLANSALDDSVRIRYRERADSLSKMIKDHDDDLYTIL